jgi:hypothetical protein
MYARTFVLAVLLVAGSVRAAQNAADPWIPLFDGKSFEGWKANENQATFSIKDDAIVVNGERSHLFYTGKVGKASFKNFEFKADVMTTPGSNSGMYIHTEFQENGWPGKGYEVQVDNSHTDPRRTGGLYGVKDVMNDSPAKDNEWFTQHIIVIGKRIVVKVNGNVTVDYTEPADVKGGRKLSRGTVALQGHDPKSLVRYKNLMVRLLPDDDAGFAPIFDGATLAGWEQKNGTAEYRVADGCIVGTTKEGSPNSFLCTQKLYGEFELLFEVNVDPRLNSGCQIRSNSMPEYQNGRVHGYQVEIASGKDSGLIYDEARRGRWLSEKRGDEAATTAFKDSAWNAFRVVCIGDTILTWVNGVPVSAVSDAMTKTGFIGLQVHSFQGSPPAEVRWRNLKLRELSAPATK